MSLLHYISEPMVEDKEKLEQDFLVFLREAGVSGKFDFPRAFLSSETKRPMAKKL